MCKLVVSLIQEIFLCRLLCMKLCVRFMKPAIDEWVVNSYVEEGAPVSKPRRQSGWSFEQVGG